MTKILFLHPVLGRGGAEIMRLNLLSNIDKKKYDIKICCIGNKDILGREMEAMGYKVDELKQDPNSLSLSITYKLIQYLKKEKPDILHTSLFASNFHGRIASLFSRIPHIVTEEHGEHKQYKGVKFIPFKAADHLLSNLTDFIICCSDELKDDIIKKERLPHSKVVAIKNCLDVKRYDAKACREVIRKKHKISFEELLFITVANLKAGKGHEYLIEVLEEIKNLRYPFKWFFVGDGPLKESLKSKVKSLKLEGEIIFIGNIDDVVDYLNASDVFVLPSFSEGLSIALMEGMLMGLASIVTDVGSNSSLVKTGFNGIVVLPGDSEGLKKAIISYLQNRDMIKEYGANSRTVIKHGYSDIDAYVNKYYEIWERCVKNKKMK